MKRSHFSILTLFFFGFFLLNLSVRASDSYTLKYKMKKGSILIYETTSKSESLQEIMGSEVVSENQSKATVKLIAEGNDKEGNLTHLMVYESMVAKIFSPMLDSTFDNPEGLIGKRVRKTIAPNGDQIKSVELDTFKLGILAQGGGLASGQEFLPNLPLGAVKMGEPVSITDVDSIHNLGGTTVTKTEVEFTFVGKETRAGYDCLKIDTKGTVSIEGDGLMQGMKFFIEGDGDFQRTLYFAPKEGVLVASESQTDIEMTAAVTGQMNMTIPITQSSKTSMKLIK